MEDGVLGSVDVPLVDEQVIASHLEAATSSRSSWIRLVQPISPLGAPGSALEQALEARQAAVPLGADLGDPARGFAQRLRFELVAGLARKSLDCQLDPARRSARRAPGEDQQLAFLGALDGSAALFSAVGAAAELAALRGVELDLVGKPLLQQIGIGDRLPDLGGGGLEIDRTADGLLFRAHAQPHGCRFASVMCN